MNTINLYEKLEQMPYGGDYNPEQWPRQVWDEDMRMFQMAGITTVTLNVFSWASIQPDEDTYDFDRLDEVVELVTKNGLNICMATATGAHPAWMAKRYPDILRTDQFGIKRKFGGRHNSCPTSATYFKYAEKLATALAEHYQDRKNIVAWHIANEFSGCCYCDHCEAEFREWLKKKYGSIKQLNLAWNTEFWGHTFYDWDEIVVPDMRSEEFGENRTVFQGISLDYKRFMSDAILKMYQCEADAIRAVIPDACITTNLMGFYKELDYFKWAEHMDIVSWDSYPSCYDTYAKSAMSHDLMRGLKNGQPFLLMEQTPSVTNWQDYNALKRPGVMRLLSYQAVAHGADSVMFFQMRKSIGACEKFHGAVIDHVGNENTRVFREIEALGKELKQIGTKTLQSRMKSKIAMIMDWDNWWAVEYSAGPSKELKYLNEFSRYYDALKNNNYDIDIVSPSMDLSAYRLVIAPLYYMVKTGMDEKIRTYVNNGGTFITTFFSGIVQENDLVVTGGYPGKLSDILGIWVEESDALPFETKHSFSYHGKQYPAELLCDLMHLKSAVMVDDHGYEQEFYKGFPVISENRFGKGKAYYVATASNEAFYTAFLNDICQNAGITPVLKTEKGIEACMRENNQETFLFLLNHNAEKTSVKIEEAGIDIISGKEIDKGMLFMEPYDVLIICHQKDLDGGIPQG